MVSLPSLVVASTEDLRTVFLAIWYINGRMATIILLPVAILLSTRWRTI